MVIFDSVDALLFPRSFKVSDDNIKRYLMKNLFLGLFYSSFFKILNEKMIFLLAINIGYI